MLITKFTDLVGCSVPIQSAGMASLSSPRLAAAVANAGGLGTVSVYGYSLSQTAGLLDEARRLSNGVICANFIMRFVDSAIAHEAVALAAQKAQVVEFFYSEPDAALVKTVHDEGALAAWQIGSRTEAVAAAKAGCDYITAQGIEAGGHVRGQVSLLALLNEVLVSVDIPVVAAGGIGSGRSMAAVLAAGAAGVRVGTRFVGSREAEAHSTYLDALIAAEAGDTVYSEIFSRGWPDAPHRTLRSCADAVQSFSGDVVGERADDTSEGRVPVYRFQPLPVTKTVSGAIEAMPLWAGESVGNVTKLQPAAEIVQELSSEAEKLLRKW